MLLAVSEITREVNRAFMLIGGVAIVLFLGVTLAMILFVVRYHRSRAPTTSQIEGHKWLEITWIVIPTLIVTWMFFVGYEGFGLMRQVPEDAMVVEVTGKQWAWSFHYPAEGVDSQEMVVPVGQPIKCELSAPRTGVIHSFYLPAFRIKEDVLPGRTTHLWFAAEREGNYNIFCAEFCGKDHSKMITVLRVVSPEAYRAWIKVQQMKRFQPLVFEAVTDPNHKEFGPDGLNIDAQALYGTFCASCHGVKGDGSGLPDEARSFQSLQDWKRSAKVGDIYRTLDEGIEGTRMRAYPNFAPWDRVALAHYIRAFIEDQPPADTQDDYDTLVQQYALDQIQPPKETIPIEKAMQRLVEEATTQPAPGA